MEGFHHDAHPMGILVSTVAALSTFYPDAKDIDDPENRNKQIIRLIAKMPTLAAGRPPLQRRACRSSTRTTTSTSAANFLSMMWKIAEPHYEPDPVLARALDVLFILHADHEQNCSTTAMRVVGSSHADPYSATPLRPRRALRPPPRRRQRGRHPDAHRDRQRSRTSSRSSPT